MAIPPSAPDNVHVVDRICSLVDMTDPDESEVVCGKDAFLHIAWDETPINGMLSSYSCAEHREEALRWDPLQYHPLGPNCGMPGAKWFMHENACGYEEGWPISTTAE